MNTPLLWYANRGTGLVLMVLLTTTVVLGLLATHGDTGRRLPRFVTQSLHRNLSLLSVVLLVLHVASAVLDEYVDIRWWQALVPVDATYKPLPLDLGTAALDVIAVAVLTSLVRDRLTYRQWRALHLGAYAAWALAIVHGFTIGTDSGTELERWCTVACVVAVVGGTTMRALAAALGSSPSRRPVHARAASRIQRAHQ